MKIESLKLSTEEFITAIAGTGLLLGKLPVDELAGVEPNKTYVVVRISGPAVLKLVGFECIPGEDALLVRQALETVEVPLSTCRAISVLSSELFSAKLKAIAPRTPHVHVVPKIAA